MDFHGDLRFGRLNVANPRSQNRIPYERMIPGRYSVRTFGGYHINEVKVGKRHSRMSLAGTQSLAAGFLLTTCGNDERVAFSRTFFSAAHVSLLRDFVFIVLSWLSPLPSTPAP